MTTPNSLQTQLKNYILSDKVFEAESILKQLGKDAAPVLKELTKSDNAQVRSNVLELAGELSDVESCRLILRLLDDPDSEVRNLAAFQVSKCSHQELIPDIITALEKHKDSHTRGILSLQLGMIGNKAQIAVLRKYCQETEDPELRQQISLALARLGNPDSRAELIQELGDVNLSVRYGALKDCLYVQDNTLAAYFTPALEDLRNVVQISIPGEMPPVYARMCDVAVTTMEALGYKFSFSAETVHVRSHEELDEARKIVSGLPKK